MAKLRTMTFDAVIVGGGGSGMRTALQLAQSGLKTACVSKVFPTRSHTVSAQGGITCAIASDDPNDDWRWHMYDTVKVSDHIGDQDAIEYMCSVAPGGRVRARAHGPPVLSHGDWTDLPATLRWPVQGLWKGRASGPDLRRGGPNGPRLATHALPAEPEGQYDLPLRVVRRRPGEEPGRRRYRRGGHLHRNRGDGLYPLQGRGARHRRGGADLLLHDQRAHEYG